MPTVIFLFINTLSLFKVSPNKFIKLSTFLFETQIRPFVLGSSKSSIINHGNYWKCECKRKVPTANVMQKAEVKKYCRKSRTVNTEHNSKTKLMHGEMPMSEVLSDQHSSWGSVKSVVLFDF